MFSALLCATVNNNVANARTKGRAYAITRTIRMHYLVKCVHILDQNMNDILLDIGFNFMSDKHCVYTRLSVRHHTLIMHSKTHVLKLRQPK